MKNTVNIILYSFMVLVLVGGVYIVPLLACFYLIKMPCKRDYCVDTRYCYRCLVTQNGTPKFQTQASWPKRALPIRPSLSRQDATLCEKPQQSSTNDAVQNSGDNLG